jgi:hypothetical protein
LFPGAQLVLELDKQSVWEGVHNGLRLLSMEPFFGHKMLIQNIHLYHVQDASDLERIKAKWKSRAGTVDSIPPIGTVAM